MSDGGGRSARRYVVRGRVQGVAFRWFIREVARVIGVAGWARNRADGTVEVVAAGSDEALAELRDALAKGPPASRVDTVEEGATTDEGWDDFTIRYDA